MCVMDGDRRGEVRGREGFRFQVDVRWTGKLPNKQAKLCNACEEDIHVCYE